MDNKESLRILNQDRCGAYAEWGANNGLGCGCPKGHKGVHRDAENSFVPPEFIESFKKAGGE